MQHFRVTDKAIRVAALLVRGRIIVEIAGVGRDDLRVFIDAHALVEVMASSRVGGEAAFGASGDGGGEIRGELTDRNAGRGQFAIAEAMRDFHIGPARGDFDAEVVVEQIARAADLAMFAIETEDGTHCVGVFNGDFSRAGFEGVIGVFGFESDVEAVSVEDWFVVRFPQRDQFAGVAADGEIDEAIGDAGVVVAVDRDGDGVLWFCSFLLGSFDGEVAILRRCEVDCGVEERPLNAAVGPSVERGETRGECVALFVAEDEVGRGLEFALSPGDAVGDGLCGEAAVRAVVEMHGLSNGRCVGFHGGLGCGWF